MHDDFNSNMFHLSPVIVPQHKSLCRTIFHELFTSSSCVYAVVDNDVTFTESTAASCNDPSWLTSRVITDNTLHTSHLKGIYIYLLTSLISSFLNIAIQERTKPCLEKSFVFLLISTLVVYCMLWSTYTSLNTDNSCLCSCWSPTLVGHRHDMRRTPLYGVALNRVFFWFGHFLNTVWTPLDTLIINYFF